MEKTILAAIIEEIYDFLSQRKKLCTVYWGTLSSELQSDEPPLKSKKPPLVTIASTIWVSRKQFVQRCSEILTKDQEVRNIIWRGEEFEEFEDADHAYGRYILYTCTQSETKKEFCDFIIKLPPEKLMSGIAFIMKLIVHIDFETKDDFLNKLRRTKRVMARGISINSVCSFLAKKYNSNKWSDFDALAKEFIKKYCPS